MCLVISRPPQCPQPAQSPTAIYSAIYSAAVYATASCSAALAAAVYATSICSAALAAAVCTTASYSAALAAAAVYTTSITSDWRAGFHTGGVWHSLGRNALGRAFLLSDDGIIGLQLLTREHDGHRQMASWNGVFCRGRKYGRRLLRMDNI